MPIANYSTTVTAMKSIGEIQGMLVAHGAEQILMDFNNETKEPTGLSFMINTQFGIMPFKLPANTDRVWAVLNKQRVRTNVPRDMAIRVSWRILKDWVRAQMAILETEMVSIEQIFLPYMQNRDGQILFDTMVNNRLQLPEG